MRSPLFTLAILAALLFSTVAKADDQETTEKPVAKPVETAEGETSTEEAPVTTAESVAKAEPVPPAGSPPPTEEAPVATAKPVTRAVPVTDTEQPPMTTTDALADAKLVPGAEMLRPDEEVLTSEKDPGFVNPEKADKDKDGKLTRQELALQDHREKLKIYDLNNDKKISKEEWKAANKENRERDEKFFLVDKDEDGEIDEGEAVGFLLERISLGSTYIDTTGDETNDIGELEIKDAAPSEVRVTLFSIPLGD